MAPPADALAHTFTPTLEELVLAVTAGAQKAT